MSTVRSAGGKPGKRTSHRRAASAPCEGLASLRAKWARQPADPRLPIEFAGWLPAFELFGNCGQHPQFQHTDTPPAGYRFVRSEREAPELVHEPAWIATAAWLFSRLLFALFKLVRPFHSVVSNCRRYGVGHCLRLVGGVAGRFLAYLAGGARLVPTLRFLRARHFPSQLLLPDTCELLFVTSVPYTYGQHPWVIEIEDPTTLFYPHHVNGQTGDMDLRRSPYFPLVKMLLEDDACRGILTHMRSTAECLPRFFASDKIGRKTFYLPCGVALPERFQEHRDDAEPINLLFTCSWHQNAQSFFLRGGLEVIEAFGVLQRRFPRLRLTLRTSLPELDEHQKKILESWNVRVISRFLEEDELDQLMRETHVFLMPAARIHVVSLLKAMAHGQVVVASDGWGISEYLHHGVNGLIVKGRYGKTSWSDPQTGILKEDYHGMYRTDHRVVRGLVSAISAVLEKPAWRRQLGQQARRDVEENYTLDLWNQRLKAALDQVLNR